MNEVMAVLSITSEETDNGPDSLGVRHSVVSRPSAVSHITSQSIVSHVSMPLVSPFVTASEDLGQMITVGLAHAQTPAYRPLPISLFPCPETLKDGGSSSNDNGPESLRRLCSASPSISPPGVMETSVPDTMPGSSPSATLGLPLHRFTLTYTPLFNELSPHKHSWLGPRRSTTVVMGSMDGVLRSVALAQHEDTISDEV